MPALYTLLVRTCMHSACMQAYAQCTSCFNYDQHQLYCNTKSYSYSMIMPTGQLPTIIILNSVYTVQGTVISHNIGHQFEACTVHVHGFKENAHIRTHLAPIAQCFYTDYTDSHVDIAQRYIDPMVCSPCWTQ